MGVTPSLFWKPLAFRIDPDEAAPSRSHPPEERDDLGRVFPDNSGIKPELKGRRGDLKLKAGKDQGLRIPGSPEHPWESSSYRLVQE